MMMDGEERLYDILNDPDEEDNLVSYLEMSVELDEVYQELKFVLFNLLESEETFKNPLDNIVSFAY